MGPHRGEKLRRNPLNNDEEDDKVLQIIQREEFFLKKTKLL